jgi:exodeoxyribonuclease VII small subunit
VEVEMVTKQAESKVALDFEKSLQRLESIVSEMEGGSLSLEDMISRFEEGQNLLGFCSKKLNEVEKKIEKLVKKGDKVVAEPFDDATASEENDEQSVEDGELF